MLAPNIPLLLHLLLLSLLGLSHSQRRNPFLSPSVLDSRQSLGGASFLPENMVRARGLTEQLLRRYHYLQYVRTVFRHLKEEYSRSTFILQPGGDETDYLINRQYYVVLNGLAVDPFSDNLDFGLPLGPEDLDFGLQRGFFNRRTNLDEAVKEIKEEIRIN